MKSRTLVRRSRDTFARLAIASTFCATLAVGLLIAAPALAQRFAVIQNFPGGTQPSFPATLVAVAGRDGNLYSESYSGGTSNNGTVFRATPGHDHCGSRQGGRVRTALAQRGQ